MCAVCGADGLRESALAPFPSPSVTTRSTSFVVLLVAEISTASTLGRLVTLLLAFWDVLEADPDQE